MKKIKITTIWFVGFCVCLIAKSAISQTRLKAGFDKEEYIEMLKIAQKQHMAVEEWGKDTSVPAPQKYTLAYRSKTMAFENMWDLWLSGDSIAVISVRGSVSSPLSFLANFYAAMVPASGELKLENNFTFKYNFSDNPNAAVHAGFLVATAYLSKDILPKIDSCYKKLGIKNFIITGHSQGGGICYLLTSHLASLQFTNKLPGDIRFKTYCGAAPKPGNLFYAYSFEKLTADGWGYNVVNTADWVPEVPFSIQTTDDFTSINPFNGAEEMINAQKFPANLALKHAYNQMSKPAKKTRKNYQKYLGRMVSKTVKKQFPEFTVPVFFNSNNYVRTGTTIVLYADEEYYKQFPQDPKKIWSNHLIEPYLYLTEKRRP
ncbi:MAG TPA: lipase family protein [Bacteroidia bacterium]|nr:lipase family protein [Bacteroidia bacterium]